MPPEAFEYAILRVVPRVERGEGVNVGVVVFCRTKSYLDALIDVGQRQTDALAALDEDFDLEAVGAHLEATRKVLAGDPDGGPLSGLAAPERFRWVTSPSSTMIQPSDVHGGVTDDPAESLRDLFDRLVR